MFKRLCETHRCYLFLNQSISDKVTQEFLDSAYYSSWVAGHNSAQVHKQISELNLDVLIDLSGHTAGNRLDVLAMRSAPLQLSWLGFPGSTGVANVDAVLLSKDLITPATPSYFTESIQVVDAPQFVYRPPEYLPQIAPAPCLKNDYVTFGCFNNIAKLNDDVLICWSRLLIELPNSRLILKWKTLADAFVQNILLKRFHSLGVHRSRIELRAASEHQAMLAEYADVDIGLDPFPFSGALTSFEAAWMGVATITLSTHKPISRQTLSLNRSIGLDDWCVQTKKDYVETVKAKTQDIQMLDRLRQSMRDRLSKASSYDANSMAQEIEKSVLSLINDRQ